MAEILKIKRPSGAMFDAAVMAADKLRRAGFMTYWVGGAPRDIALNRVPADVDMVTCARPEEIKEVFPEAEMVGACFGVVLVKCDDFTFEVATCREERSYQDGRHPESIRFTKDFVLDIQRRDFTVNAMLYDPFDELLIDHAGGLQDLRQRVIRVVGKPEERFAEDHLRLFRAIRFAARLKFDIEENAWQTICSMKFLSRSLAAERVRQELELMLTSANPAEALELLKNCGLLQVWLPEVDALAGVEQYAKYHPEGDVWQHTLLMFRNLNEPASVKLAWSILLHDIGKKAAYSCGSDNIPHFYCHESIGADMVAGIACRLRFSAELTECVTHAVRNHMRFANVVSMRQAKLKRLLAEKDFLMELELHRLDCLSSNGLMETYNFLQEKLSSSQSVQLPELLLNGNDLIAMGYKPGRAFKIMLDALMDAQLENCVIDRSQAVDMIKNSFPLPDTDVGSDK